MRLSLDLNFVLQNINERYRATSLAFSQMLNPDYIPPAADDVLDSPKKVKSIEPRNLSRTMSDDIDELGSQPPELEDMDDTLAGTVNQRLATKHCFETIDSFLLFLSRKNDCELPE